MSKKISGAHIKINGALGAVLRIDKGAFSAAANISSPIDHVTFVEGATYRATLRFDDAISLITDTFRLTFGKNPSEVISATDERVIFVFDKGIPETIIASDTFVAEIDFNLSITDYETILDVCAVDFGRPLYSFVDSPTDFVTLHPEKGVHEIVPALDVFSRTVDYNVPLADFPLAIESLSRSVSYIRSYSDITEVVSDLAAITAGKSFTETISNDDSSTRAVVKNIFETPLILDEATITASFYRTLVDASEAQERKYLTFEKAVASDSNAATDSFVLTAIKVVADLFSVADQKSLSIAKTFSDIAQALDLIAIFDGSQYVFEKGLADSTGTTDSIFITKGAVRDYADTASIFDDISTFDFIKNLNETAHTDNDIHQIDYSKPLSDGVSEFIDEHSYALIKPFSEEMVVSDTPALSFSRPLPNQTVSLSDFRTNTIIKAFSEVLVTIDSLVATDGSKFIFSKSFAETSITSDTFYRLVSFIRTVNENERALEGPGYGSESGYATGYFAPDDGVMYTEEFRPVWALNKVLSDSQSTTDKLSLSWVKPLANETVAETDNAALHPTKILAHTVQANTDLFSRAVTFLRTFIDRQFTLPGPIPYDQDDYSDLYFDPDYIRDYRVLFNFNKGLKHLTDAIDSIPALVNTKILVDNSTPLDANAYHFFKVLSSFATPEDLVGIFDGSQYSFDKTIATQIATASDDEATVQFTFGKSDATSSATSGGKLISSDYFTDLTYFTLLSDYIGQSRSFIPIEDLLTLSGSEDLMSESGYVDLMI